VVAASALLLGAPAPSRAATVAARKPPVRSLCADTVTVRDSPRGYAIGHLAKPQKLKVLVRSRAGKAPWVLVRAAPPDDDLTGWIPEGALCRPR
jgi:hypothetical protein